VALYFVSWQAIKPAGWLAGRLASWLAGKLASWLAGKLDRGSYPSLSAMKNLELQCNEKSISQRPRCSARGVENTRRA